MSQLQSLAPSVIARYRSAYRVATFFTFVGRLVFWGGVVLAILPLIVPMLLTGILSADRGSPELLERIHGARPAFAASIVFGLPIGFAILCVAFVISTLCRAIGQLLRAQLDSAVHTSPFLSDGEKASAMGI